MLLTGVMMVYGLYSFLFGVLVFTFHQPNMGVAEHEIDRNSPSDRVVLVEDRLDAAVARIHLIENAIATLDIAYYTIHAGKASDVYFSSLVSAADRGVQVRILLDGLFHNLTRDRKEFIYAFAIHPNIELKFYEPFDTLRPWTWNNRLHDKLMIVDEKLAMIGGRNIGDDYFALEGYVGAKIDRDVVILNSLSDDSSVIYQMKEYYDALWEHDFSQSPLNELTKKQQNQGEEKVEELRFQVATFRADHKFLFHQEINWLERSLPTNNIRFVHNPIERLNKEPIVWREIASLIENAEQSMYLQSPYVIPTKDMRSYLDETNVTADNIVILTNSLAATPNALAFSGYMSYRKTLAKSGIELYEYQSVKDSLHAKTYIFDQKITAIGTFNLDPRSTFLSTEAMVMIDSEEVAEQILQELLALKEKSSLKVNTDGSSIENPNVKEAKVSFTKGMITRSLAIVTRFFHHML